MKVTAYNYLNVMPPESKSVVDYFIVFSLRSIYCTFLDVAHTVQSVS